MSIHIDKIYDLMADRGFQIPRTGNLFFPVYIYTYPAEQEYALREELDILIKKLKRPNHYLNSLIVNIYDELINYLKQEQFAGNSLFDLIISKEQEDPEDALSWIKDEINSGAFYEFIENKFKAHFNNDPEKKVYLILYGFGSAFPYLRASHFLKNTEKLVKEFKIILFYPGDYKDSNYNLFSILNDDNMYRANNLNNLLGESTNSNINP